MSDSRSPIEPAPDKTFVRPRPGGGPRDPKGPPPMAAAPAVRSVDVALGDFLAGGRNRQLAAASSLLTLGARIQGSVFQADVPALRREAKKAVEAYLEQCRAGGVREEDAVIGRYILCTFVDSAVFRTPWGSRSDWASQSLLLHFHQDMAGGKTFFEILEKMQTDPGRYIDLLELQYVCLLLGFEGRYLNDEPKLTEIRERLASAVRQQRGTPGRLSVHWQGVQDRRSRVLRLLPWWVVGVAGLVILLAVWIGLRSLLANEAAPLRARLAAQGLESLVAEASRPTQVARLKQLLADAERAGALTVEERDARSVITLAGTDLFASGGAVLDARHLGTIRQIAAALDQVGGSVVVAGHTDDQPVRSLRYEDNFGLSRARAVAVATLLRDSMQVPGRIEWTGLGDTQPRFTPVSLKENRARNRRVEILHIAAAAASGGVQ